MDGERLGGMIVRAVKWLAGRLLRLLPETVRGALLPGGFHYSVADIPPATVAPATAVRLYVAPVNYAGQGWQWARAAERNIEGVGAVNTVCRIGADFRHPADVEVPLGVYAASSRWQRAEFAAVTSGFTHVIVEAEKPPFGAVLDETTRGQVERLRAAGIAVAMLCHGSDIRLPSRHIADNDSSVFADALAATAPVLEKVARENRRLLDELGAPVFVSTPDLLRDVPYATWLPVVIEPSAWASETVPLERGRPIVAHAPSRAAMKGSELVDPVLAALDAEGLIEYRRIVKVPYGEMADIYRTSDIVLDQFRLGDYGVAACEAMAAGRVVVAHVNERTRAAVLEASGLSLPIVQSTTDEIEGVIRAIVADRETYRAMAEQGPQFVEAVHNGRMSADVLRGFLL